MYSFPHSLKFHCTVKFQHSLLNDSAYTVRSVRAIVILIFHPNVFKLLLCDLLQYQNHKKFLRVTLPKHWCILLLHVADGYVGSLRIL
jgi:hypothetical protein